MEDFMRIAPSLEAVEGEETSCCARQRHTQARFAEGSEGYESDATQIVHQILAKLGPELWPTRDMKHQPPTPGTQRVCSAERTVTPPHRKDTSAEQKWEKSKGGS